MDSASLRRPSDTTLLFATDQSRETTPPTQHDADVTERPASATGRRTCGAWALMVMRAIQLGACTLWSVPARCMRLLGGVFTKIGLFAFRVAAHTCHAALESIDGSQCVVVLREPELKRI